MRLLLILASFLILSFKAQAFDPFEHYGERIVFDVVRKGEIVGQHETIFEKTDHGFIATSKMKIDISLWFLPVYRFDYKSIENWQNNQLITVDVDVVDGSDRLIFSAVRDADGFEIVRDGQTYRIDPNVLTTNHWNPLVLKSHHVLNTLTGNINNVTITPEQTDYIQTNIGKVQADQYRYSGDLNDVWVWYDKDGRWVKLRFKAKDGSMIDYKCRTCQKEARTS